MAGVAAVCILEGDSGLNTLVDFRHLRKYKAQNGQGGSGRNMTGKSGEDIIIRVPLGTIVTEQESGEHIGDVTEHGQQAAGGKRRPGRIG